MSDEPERRGVAARARAMLVAPRATWSVIAVEPTTVRRLFIGYAMPLAAVHPLAFTLGRLAFGERVLGAVYRPPVVAALIEGVFSYGFMLGAVAVLALLIEALAPAFVAVKDRTLAFKAAIYASTAGWLAGVVYLVPALGVLALVGQAYTLYLLYLGIGILLRPGRRTLGYVALVVVSYAVLSMLALSLTKLLAALV